MAFVWEVFAGTLGTAGSDDGVGTAATFNHPYGVTVGHDGSYLIVCDLGSNVAATDGALRRVDLLTRQVDTLVSGLTNPWFASVAGTGNIYVSRMRHDSILVYDDTGSLLDTLTLDSQNTVGPGGGWISGVYVDPAEASVWGVVNRAYSGSEVDPYPFRYELASGDNGDIGFRYGRFMDGDQITYHPVDGLLYGHHKEFGVGSLLHSWDPDEAFSTSLGEVHNMNDLTDGTGGTELYRAGLASRTPHNHLFYGLVTPGRGVRDRNLDGGAETDLDPSDVGPDSPTGMAWKPPGLYVADALVTLTDTFPPAYTFDGGNHVIWRALTGQWYVGRVVVPQPSEGL